MHDTIYPALASVLGALYNDPARVVPERTGNRHSGLAVAPYNVYRAADGHIAIMSANERHAIGVMELAGGAEMTSDPRYATRYSRLEHMDELDAQVEAWTRGFDRWALVRMLAEKGVPSAPVLTVREVAEDPHLRERGMIRDVEHPLRGTIPVPGSPIRLGDSSVEVRAAPELAEGTNAILAELLEAGDEQIAMWRREGAFGETK